MLGLTLPFSASICIWILLWRNMLNKEDYLVICSILLQVRVIIFCILMNGYHVSYSIRLVDTHLKTFCLHILIEFLQHNESITKTSQAQAKLDFE